MKNVLKNLVLTTSVFAFFFIFPSLVMSQCRVTIDGNQYCDIDVLTSKGIPEPSVSASGEGNIYFDWIEATWFCSADGGGYTECINKINGSDVLLDTSNFDGILDVNDDTAQEAFDTIDDVTQSTLPCDKDNDPWCFVVENGIVRLYINESGFQIFVNGEGEFQVPDVIQQVILTADDGITILTADDGITELIAN